MWPQKQNSIGRGRNNEFMSTYLSFFVSRDIYSVDLSHSFLELNLISNRLIFRGMCAAISKHSCFSRQADDAFLQVCFDADFCSCEMQDGQKCLKQGSIMS